MEVKESDPVDVTVTIDECESPKVVVFIVGNDSEVIDKLLIASVTLVVMLDLSVDNFVSLVVDSSVVSSGTVTVSVLSPSVSVMV